MKRFAALLVILSVFHSVDGSPNLPRSLVFENVQKQQDNSVGSFFAVEDSSKGDCLKTTLTAFLDNLKTTVSTDATKQLVSDIQAEVNTFEQNVAPEFAKLKQEIRDRDFKDLSATFKAIKTEVDTFNKNVGATLKEFEPFGKEIASEVSALVKQLGKDVQSCLLQEL